ncbi:hypothetical protein PF005_g26093 [Phytophthora fragariae]|uniref:HTH CENPB-type domain-containing protein n=1 Tax=Phytophthora fragariae TaxID=53985 RepID=A0A6A3R0D9_9STRA|nr:hypothetical protein PF003_g30691 [Phytophthora fragariae]KAE8921938.1 hypothetical protein PF009_g27789 [Phytophthora fragariae]KAE8973321.1 hypothetical protein PF011_g25303 [Phytophthora fragariae]KAE9070075.1 hypothetical protein PF010_g26429 [Phytophthora fragariae]KAE9071590.1 hypothetical protein PF007_g26495 [Phytophthora fragariae]
MEPAAELSEGARRPLLGVVEDALIDLIYEKRIRKEKVSRSWIALTAIQLFQASRMEEEQEEDPIRFVVSDSWVHNFMARNNLTLRKRTNLTTLTDDVLVDHVVAFMKFLEDHKPHMNHERTILMDETSVYLEEPDHTLSTFPPSDLTGSLIGRSPGSDRMLRRTNYLSLARVGLLNRPLICIFAL